MTKELQRYLQPSGLLAVVILMAGGTGTLAGGSAGERRIENLEEKVHGIAVTQGKILTEVEHLKDEQEKVGDFVDSVIDDRRERDAKLYDILKAVEDLKE